MRLALAAILTFVLDQATKYLVVIHLNLREVLSIDVLPPVLNFRMAWNEGINFGLLDDYAASLRWVWVVLSVVISIAVLIWARRTALKPLAAVSAGLLIGGALGNAVDRVIYGAVADFLNMSCCGINNPFSFNVADIAVFAGVIGLVILIDDKKTP